MGGGLYGEGKEGWSSVWFTFCSINSSWESIRFCLNLQQLEGSVVIDPRSCDSSHEDEYYLKQNTPLLQRVEA